MNISKSVLHSNINSPVCNIT